MRNFDPSPLKHNYTFTLLSKAVRSIKGGARNMVKLALNYKIGYIRRCTVMKNN